MGIPRSRPAGRADSADSGRRSFFRKLGAGVSTALASAAGLAATRPENADDLALRVARLEDETALRKLHAAFEQAVDDGRYDDAVALFADDAAVVFNGGVFEGRKLGIRRLFGERFRSTKTGKRMEPAPGFGIPADERHDGVEVAHEQTTATAVFPYSIRAGMPIESDTSLADMARLHGEGVRTWWEGGEYVVTYRRDAAGDRWRIGRLEYRTLARADFRSGRSYAAPIAVASIAACFPEDPHGPDALV